MLVAALKRAPTPAGREPERCDPEAQALEQRKVRIDQALRGPADLWLAKLAGELKKTRKTLEGPPWPVAQISLSGALQSSRTQAQ